MYDDAYVIVGHLDAAGRLKIVFPSAPGDDGFVRGDKIYHVPTFFAGFADEYAWRYNDYRYRYHSIDSRNDSYDAGLGYVFVIASWRPMRLDRIANGNKWETYDVSDISYMQDPREAIEELGSVIAGDNREAYTIQYAHYTTTNYGTYSFSDFDAVNGGCSSLSSYGFGGFGVPSLFFSPYSFLSSYGCPNYYGLNYGYPLFFYGYGNYGFAATSPFFRPPTLRPPVVPIGAPAFHRPTVASALGLHKPESGILTSAPMPAATNGSSAYHRPGLVAEDAGIRGTGRGADVSAPMHGVESRPSIQEVIGKRRIDDGNGAIGTRDNSGGWASRQPSWMNRGGVSTSPREQGGVYRSGGRSIEGTRSTPSYSAPRSAPHIERSAPSHSAPARIESPRSSPPPSSSGSKKP
jgi:hypothetical protein